MSNFPEDDNIYAYTLVGPKQETFLVRAKDIGEAATKAYINFGIAVWNIRWATHKEEEEFLANEKAAFTR